MSEFREQIIEHWQSFRNPLINDVLTNLEKLELEHHGALSEQEETAIESLLKTCETAKPEHVDEAKMVILLNQMPAAYMLFMVHKLQTLNTDLIMKIISYAQKHKDNDPIVGSFFQRNMVFEKSQLLGRIFSTARMEVVLETLVE